MAELRRSVVSSITAKGRTTLCKAVSVTLQVPGMGPYARARRFGLPPARSAALGLFLIVTLWDYNLELNLGNLKCKILGFFKKKSILFK